MKVLEKKERSKILLDFLNELWLQYGSTTFSTTVIGDKMRDLRINQALVTHLTSSGLLRRTNRGYCAINFKPTMKSIEMMNIEEVKSMKKQFLKAKEKRLKEKEFLLNKSTENLIPSCIEDNSKAINEENAIKLLKSLGYKILKPIEPQYREI